MTPKEKAKELVEKFKNRSIELGETHSQLMAEANALIAVDEIIKTEFQTVEKLLKIIKQNKIKIIMSLNKDYWQEVKQEIEKL